MTTNFNDLPEEEIVESPYISVEIDEDSIDPVYRAVEKVLTDLNLEYNKVPRPHISIAYVLGNQPKHILQQILSEISESSFKIKALGVGLLYSSYFEKDLIYLDLQFSADFDYAQSYISENYEVKQYEGGFKSHITLFSLEAGIITPEMREKFAEVLEMFVFQVIAGLKVAGETISMFDANRVNILILPIKK